MLAAAAVGGRRARPCAAADAAAEPATYSPGEPPAPTGALPGIPRDASDPHQACIVKSVAARVLHGPAATERRNRDQRGRRIAYVQRIGAETERFDLARARTIR